MKRARAFGAWGLSVIVGAGMLWACSASSTEVGGGGTGGGQDATTNDSSSYSSNDSGTITPSDSGIVTHPDSGADGSAGPCGSSTTAASCYQCCDTISDGGVEQFFNLQTACICSARHCDTNATCKKTLCANPDTDDAGTACNNCQNKEFADDAGDAGCVDPVLNECAGEAFCAQGIECVIDSNCNSLP